MSVCGVVVCSNESCSELYCNMHLICIFSLASLVNHFKIPGIKNISPGSSVDIALLKPYCPTAQVTFHDDGHILYPSITFCKNYMYTHNEGFLHKLKEDKLSSSEYKKIFREQTWSRDQLLKTLHHNTLDESFKFPCTTIDGPNSGFPCSFPFVYPDCSESFRPKNQCEWN